MAKRKRKWRKTTRKEKAAKTRAEFVRAVLHGYKPTPEEWAAMEIATATGGTMIWDKTP